MPIIGPGHDDPENDNYDPAWHDQDTPFRCWLEERLAANGMPPEIATMYAPTNRYHGLSDNTADNIAYLVDVGLDDVRAAHKADLAEWAREQELRNHPDLAALDADLNRIQGRG